MFDLHSCLERKHYSLDMVQYLKKEDLEIFDISRIPEVLSPSLNFKSPETFYFYVNYNKDKISEDEREYYLQIAQELKQEEKLFIDEALSKLTLNSN